ncbi:Protein-lysine methyltransferase METTL21D [Glycine soja]|uniref:Protein-lysine methyltransferase METTL21D n=1 Tax=Glycine soja TaxID=3848 RepID=A0A445L8G4_GLYSO|nr:Protein-lysine methyltransferase METTL21D [Glycine soja]
MEKRYNKRTRWGGSKSPPPFNAHTYKGHKLKPNSIRNRESEDTMANNNEEEEEAVTPMVKLGSYGAEVRLVVGGEESAAEETMLLWGIQQPTLSKPNAFVSQASLQLSLDSCGHSLSILQSPSSLDFCFKGTPGVTGAVMWDSGVVLGKFLEHAVDSGMLVLQGKKIVELGSGCGLVGCIAALLGSEVIVTDLRDRLRLLRKNIETNMKCVSLRGSVTATELIWGEDPDPELIDPTPDFVVDLLETLMQLSGSDTTIFLAGELRNDAILEYFLEAAMDNFTIGRVEQTLWHPDYCSNRVVLYVLVKK